MACYSVSKRNELSSSEKTWKKLNTYYKIKEANKKIPQNMWFQNDDILEMYNYGNSKKINGCQGTVGREGQIGKLKCHTLKNCFQ